MILIDALYINNGGGKVLLNYLIKCLEETDLMVFYLLDLRTEGTIPYVKKTNKVQYLKASIENRKKFYQSNNKFSSVLCFGNLPPFSKINANVYTYFHQPLFLKIPQSFSLKSKISYFLKQNIIRMFKKNTDYWIVQSPFIKEELSKKYIIKPEEILELPFYIPLSPKNKTKISNSYVYVSNANTHKNHQNLIEGFCIFYDKYKRGSLTLTVDESFNEIFNLIEHKKKMGYPIHNIGFVNHEQMSEVFSKAEFHIFPSLAESFGLGLVEAINCGCKVIGADLPYTYAVCKPSIVFNPLEVDSIVSALCLSLQDNIPPSQAIVKNQIQNIIEILK